MRVFVTGASGFIGAALSRELLAAGHDVAVLSRNSEMPRLDSAVPSLRVISGSMDDIDRWRGALEAFQPEAVAHLAWGGVANFDRDSLHQLDNVPWTGRLIAAAADAGAQCFLGVGSQAEYGPRSAIMRPDDPTAPTSLYGHAKLATSNIADAMCSARDMRFVWMRVFSTYGSGDHDYWMIPNLILQLLRGERPALTQGEQLWDFLHVSDAARSMRYALEISDARGIYALGSGDAPPLRETIEMIRDLVNPALPLGFGEVPYRDDQVMRLQADISKLKADLGWEPSVSLEDGLAETVDWFRSEFLRRQGG